MFYLKSYLKMPNINHLIIDYYESLARRVDDYTEEQLNKYTNKQLIEIGEVEEKVEGTTKTEENLDLVTSTDLLSYETEKKISPPYLLKDDDRLILDFKDRNKMT